MEISETTIARSANESSSPPNIAMLSPEKKSTKHCTNVLDVISEIAEEFT